MRRLFNMPGDYIHDVAFGFGRLVLPLPFSGGRWIALSKWQFRSTWHQGFHNCTATGVY